MVLQLLLSVFKDIINIEIVAYMELTDDAS